MHRKQYHALHENMFIELMFGKLFVLHKHRKRANGTKQVFVKNTFKS